MLKNDENLVPVFSVVIRFRIGIKHRSRFQSVHDFSAEKNSGFFRNRRRSRTVAPPVNVSLIRRLHCNKGKQSKLDLLPLKLHQCWDKKKILIYVRKKVLQIRIIRVLLSLYKISLLLIIKGINFRLKIQNQMKIIKINKKF